MKGTILWHISSILDLSEEAKFDNEFIKTVKPSIDCISEIYNISPEQAVLFSHFFGRGDDNSISIDDIARSINCKPIDLLFYQSDISELVQKRLIVEYKDRNHRTKYYIPQHTFESINTNKPLFFSNHKNLSIYDLFDLFEEFIERCTDKEMSSDTFIREVNSIIDNNLHLTFSRAFKSYRLKETCAAILIFFCEKFVNNDDDEIYFSQMEDMFESSAVFRRFKSTFTDRTNMLFHVGLIENTKNNGFVEREAFKLTDKAKKELLPELNVNLIYAGQKKDLILADSIVKKKMYYNPTEDKTVMELTSLLMPEAYGSITMRLREAGMRTGFACLFYGEPGTGKTETVNMIAKNTGRDIMKVDISQTKSCWFGESEKKIKKIFDKYHAYVEVNETAPILLLNEADAVIGKRKDVAGGSVAQTENTIQNIILQELENLNGILIATTNLTKNLDRAFERRFLYKIEFKKPDLKIRELLWKEMIPELKDNEANILAERFNFSGGQIENISRRKTIDSVLSGENVNIEKLIEYCHDELLQKENNKPIGFNSNT